MSIEIFINHPNNIIHTSWRFVGRVETLQEAQDVIASPDFEYQYGTLVSVIAPTKELYSGIYGHSECMSINTKIFGLWAVDHSALQAIMELAPLINHRMLARIACVCLRSIPQIGELTGAGEDVLIAVEKWSIGKSDETAIYKAREYFYREDIEFAIDEELYYRISLVDHYLYRIYVMSAIQNFIELKSRSDVTAMRELRRQIPFYDIVDDILKLASKI